MKKSFLLVLVMNMLCVAYSQTPLVSRKNANVLIEKSLSDAFFIVKKGYLIEDTAGQQFGRKNQDFNTSYSLGVKMEGGFVLSAAAVNPWIGDTAYDAFRDKYRPVPGKTEYKAVKDRKFVGLQDSSLQTNDSLVFTCRSDIFGNVGLLPDVEKSDKHGFVVWVCFPDSNNAFDSISFIINSKQISAKQLDSSGLKMVDPRKNSVKLLKNGAKAGVLGGIYVTPYYKSAGIIELRLCGVIVNQGGGWVMEFPFKDCKKCEVTMKKEDVLTPVETPKSPKSKKSKK